MKRRSFVQAAAALAAFPALAGSALPPVTAYTGPGCECCGKWVEHLRMNGFKVSVIKTDDTAAMKRRLGVPEAMWSCHTAIVGAYVIEGHVPAADIRRLIQERGAARGLAVPGMVAGSPGMEGARRDAFNTLAFDAGGHSRIYARH